MVRIKAFTLIVLLVVFAIITILSAILMPTLQRFREQAKGTPVWPEWMDNFKDFAPEFVSPLSN
ncbi:MAG: type II secretion system protein [Planctomycetota bacterium]|jgi:Tfp pilus assembly protein PilE